MPSDALIAWQTVRMPRLDNVEADCLHIEVLHAGDPDRVQEFIRSYAVLFYAEFQGYCRDLHDECADRLIDSINVPALRDVLRSQCVYRRTIDKGNPTSGNLGEDFNRFQFRFWPNVLAMDPGHQTRKAE